MRNYKRCPKNSKWQKLQQRNLEVSEEQQVAEATTEELQEVPEEQQAAEAMTEGSQEVSEELK